MTKTLKGKLTLLLILVVFASTTLGGVLNGFDNPIKTIFLMVILPLILVTCGALIINKFLKPLETLYQGVETISKGQTGARINLSSSDEIGQIAQIINSLTQNLDGVVEKEKGVAGQAVAGQSRLETIISSLTDGVIVLDLHRQVVLMNKAAEKLTGLGQSEAVGRSIDTLLIIKDAFGQTLDPKSYCSFDLIQEAPHPLIFISVKLIGKNNLETQIKLTSTPIDQGIQSDLGCILILHDYSSEKNLEQMEVDFVSMASHEIRTPLTSIINYLAVLVEEAKEKLTTEQFEFLNRALDSAKQLTVLVNNLLNVSKVERGSFSVTVQPLNWSNFLTKIVTETQVQASQKHISLNLKLPSSLPLVLADQMRIAEVLNNLISNAINYTNPNGTIEVGTSLQNNEIVTFVKDTGRGIPKEAIPHLFAKFFRVDGLKEGNYKGTGLGLYISKSIVDLHHGKIWVESEIGQGSTFYFSLPQAPSSGASIANLLSNLGPTGVSPVASGIDKSLQNP